jgi:hypothetical protein
VKSSRGFQQPFSHVILMERFVRGQKWCSKGAVDGDLFAEVVQISGNGRSGTVVITDAQGNVIDTFDGTVDQFQASGRWEPLE